MPCRLRSTSLDQDDGKAIEDAMVSHGKGRRNSWPKLSKTGQTLLLAGSGNEMLALSDAAHSKVFVFFCRSRLCFGLTAI